MVKTCPAAMGFAFAAGTTDGPGAFDFKQGDDKVRNFWSMFDPSSYKNLNWLNNSSDDSLLVCFSREMPSGDW